jgi:hypothetical protein
MKVAARKEEGDSQLAVISYYVTVIPVNRPSIWNYLPQPERDRIPPEDREIGRFIRDTGFSIIGMDQFRSARKLANISESCPLRSRERFPSP